MVKTGTIDTLIMMLRDSNSVVVQAGLMTVLSLMRHVNGCMTIFESELHVLVSMLLDWEWRVRQSAAKIICTVLQHDIFMANPAIVTPEMAGKVLSTLADPRWDVRESGLKIVLTLAQQGGYEILSAQDNILKIAASLQDRNPDMRRLALEAVSALAKHDAIHSVLSVPETMREIVKTLDDPSPAIQHLGRDIILTLTAHASSSSEMIHKTMWILWAPGEDLRESRAETVLAISQQDGGCAAIFKSDMIERILSMLVRPEEEVRASGRRIVYTLSRNDTFGTAISSPETLPAIISMLINPNWDVRCTGLEIICAVCQKTVVTGAISINKVITMLQDRDFRVQQSGFRTISALAQHAEVHAVLTKPDSIQLIMMHLRDLNSKVCQSAFETVLALSLHVEEFALILKAEMLPTLLSAEWKVPFLIPPFIRALSQHDELRVAISTPESVQKIISMLHDPGASVRKSGLQIGLTLIKTAWRMVFLTTDIVNKIVSMLMHSEWYVQESGRCLILALIEHADMRDAISTAETMGKISTMLFNAQRYVRQSAVMVLAALSAQPTGVQPMLETIETIVTMLQDPMHDVRKSALDVFTRLAQNGGPQSNFKTRTTSENYDDAGGLGLHCAGVGILGDCLPDTAR
ncbi:armadillo-type protein [Mycena leptocephala]|nr:armadillo-type protein [Mycena leptocephala]